MPKRKVTASKTAAGKSRKIPEEAAGLTQKPSSKETELGSTKMSADSARKSSSVIFPIVGLGASAGGLEALKAFFSAVPSDTGMAFVVVVHISPKQPSMMPELLQKITRIPVLAAEDGHRVETNTVYIIPPKKELSIFGGKLQLLEAIREGVGHPINIFLRSLAQDQGDLSAAVILSGTGTDGTLGLKDIKCQNGLVFAQLPESAGYDGMPRSAIDTGLVDVVLPPEDMPGKLVDYFRHVDASFTGMPVKQGMPDQDAWLSKILTIVRSNTGHDFSAYKTNSLKRRISRRMGLNGITKPDAYIRYIRENPTEVTTLFRELLIGVTSFFRDKESFEALKVNILPKHFESTADDATVRVWVPGCSTGEEVYSLAIVFQEVLERSPRRINIQFFGTDIDNRAIERARSGNYPASIELDVSPRRLKRFFTKENGSYRIRKEVRDRIVFSTQDIINDPPFSRLDMLCCRNLLIYFSSEAQKKLLPLFHYTLKPGGILMLGTSETIGRFGSIFRVLDKKWKIFRKKEGPRALHRGVDFPIARSTTVGYVDALPVSPAVRPANIDLIVQKAVLDKFAPTAVLVDGKGEIIHFQGRTGNYLEQLSGPPIHNILDLAREGLRIELSSALRAARSSAAEVKRSGLTVKNNGDERIVDMHVLPLTKPVELAGLYLVVFEDIAAGGKAADLDPNRDKSEPAGHTRISELEHELQITREGHQTTIEELESSNEELKSTNEEMQSAIEELQSSNEELESSKEELQSLNEELQTVNAEIQSKVEELSAAHDDMHNLLNSTEIATIFVDNDMRVKRFTQSATEIVNLIPADAGRPLKHVTSNLKYDMFKAVDEVNKSLISFAHEVETENGKWFRLNIIPYRTLDNRIDGSVITFIDITEQRHSRELVRAVFDMNTDPLVVLDMHGKMVIANTSFSDLMGLSLDQIRGLKVQIIQQHVKRRLGLEKKLLNVLKDGDDFETVPFTIGPEMASQKFTIYGQAMKMVSNRPYRILLRFVPRLT